MSPRRRLIACVMTRHRTERGPKSFESSWLRASPPAGGLRPRPLQPPTSAVPYLAAPGHQHQLPSSVQSIQRLGAAWLENLASVFVLAIPTPKGIRVNWKASSSIARPTSISGSGIPVKSAKALVDAIYLVGRHQAPFSPHHAGTEVTIEDIVGTERVDAVLA